MRQFFLDQVTAKKADPTTRIRWYFDTFRNKKAAACTLQPGGFYDNDEMNNAREVMSTPPSFFDNKFVKVSTGYNTVNEFKRAYSTESMINIVRNEGFMDKAFKFLVIEGHSLVKEDEIQGIVDLLY